MAKRAKKALVEQPSPDLPPAEPRTSKELTRAIVLLGSRSTGLSLSARVRVELIALVGAYPDPATAASWKRALKSVRDDEIFDPAD